MPLQERRYEFLKRLYTTKRSGPLEGGTTARYRHDEGSTESTPAQTTHLVALGCATRRGCGRNYRYSSLSPAGSGAVDTAGTTGCDRDSGLLRTGGGPA